MSSASLARRVPLNDGSIAAVLDSSLDTLWVSLRTFPGRPHNFSPELLAALENLLDRLEDSRWHWPSGNTQVRLRYAVLASEHPLYFSLGGDLAFFQSCIEKGDAGALHAYSMRCLNLIHRLFALRREMTTIALVRGRALGGGFETALSACHLVAERDADFGFPEISFGTFPCSGGMSLLAHRIGLHRAATFIRTPRIHSAGELHAQGVVDELCEPDGGVAAVQRFIGEHRKRYNARMALQRAELRMAQLDIDELRTVVEDWVETAMNLSREEKRVLATLVRMQQADVGKADAPAEAPPQFRMPPSDQRRRA